MRPPGCNTMNVLFIIRSTLFSNKGGDTIQIVQTAHCLRELGVSVTVVSTLEEIAYEGYDLLHFFNITRPADILSHIERSGKPFVVTPIFVDYSEFDRNFRKGPSGFVLGFLGTNGIEFVKTVGRFLLKGERIGTVKYLLQGQKRSIKKILHSAKLLLPNSYSEYNRLFGKYGVEKNYSVIPNAVSDLFIRAAQDIPEKIPFLVLCVARIEGLKNQLNLIKALNNTRYTLVLIGQPATHQMDYYQACRQTAASNVQFIGYLPQDELLGHYLKAKVHVLPSWFETTGLSSLEGAALGCNIVITDKGDTKEYFGSHAWYCDPSSPDSIRRAVDEAAASGGDGALQKKIVSEYTWAQAAIKTRSAYLRITGHKQT
jgi:glycosyltransferase involved in cell wall biosynthesis